MTNRVELPVTIGLDRFKNMVALRGKSVAPCIFLWLSCCGTREVENYIRNIPLLLLLQLIFCYIGERFFFFVFKVYVLRRTNSTFSVSNNSINIFIGRRMREQHFQFNCPINNRNLACFMILLWYLV